MRMAWREQFLVDEVISSKGSEFSRRSRKGRLLVLGRKYGMREPGRIDA